MQPDYLTMTLMIIGGLTALVIGGELLVRSSVSIAKKFGVSTLIIGLTIIAYGTSAPELIVNVQAILKQQYDIAVGNIIGSNISNILLVLGAAAAICTIKTDKIVALRDGRFLLLVTILMCISGFIYPYFKYAGINIFTGLLFLLLLAAYTYKLFVTAKTDRKLKAELTEDVGDADEGKETSLLVSIGLILAGFALLFSGAHYLVLGASNLAKTFGVTQGVIAVTIVAFGSSAPEFFASVVSAYRKQTELVVGNILGSCIFNIAGVIGISGLMDSFYITGKFMNLDIYYLMAATGIFIASLFIFKKLSSLWGLVLVGLYVSYIALQF